MELFKKVPAKEGNDDVLGSGDGVIQQAGGWQVCTLSVVGVHESLFIVRYLSRSGRGRRSNKNQRLFIPEKHRITTLAMVVDTDEVTDMAV